MKFLIDNALSPQVAAGLRRAGHDAIHVRQRSLEKADDEVILDLTCAEDRILISADTDFGAILAARVARKPSVVLFRGPANHRPSRQVEILTANLHHLDRTLAAGCLIAIDANRIRVRALPIIRKRRGE